MTAYFPAPEMLAAAHAAGQLARWKTLDRADDTAADPPQMHYRLTDGDGVTVAITVPAHGGWGALLDIADSIEAPRRGACYPARDVAAATRFEYSSRVEFDAVDLSAWLQRVTLPHGEYIALLLKSCGVTQTAMIIDTFANGCPCKSWLTPMAFPFPAPIVRDANGCIALEPITQQQERAA